LIRRHLAICLIAVLASAQVPSTAVASKPAEQKPSHARWELKYFYDEDDSSLVLLDLKFPSARRGVASGTIVQNSRLKNVVVLTSDGGDTWSVVPVNEPGYSLFFLNESVGWMVAPKAIWKTVESGRSWKKIPKTPKLARRVHFLDEMHGYALCGLKSVYTTADGGTSWTLLPASQEPSAKRDFAAYEAVDFEGSRGLITGWSDLPRQDRRRLPDWMEPDKAKLRREWPTLNIVLETLDGGKNWKTSTVPIFGRISRVDVGANRSLALLEFRNAFEVPSEVISIDAQSGKSTSVFRKPDRKVTDLLLLPHGPAYLAAIEAVPAMPNSPVPGRLKMIRSHDFTHWEEMEVDYRASGTRAVLAAPDASNVWVATNTGAILKLSPFQNN
jgi:hypothetical protein